MYMKKIMASHRFVCISWFAMHQSLWCLIIHVYPLSPSLFHGQRSVCFVLLSTDRGPWPSVKCHQRSLLFTTTTHTLALTNPHRRPREEGKKEHHPFVRNSVSKTPREKKKKPRGEKARMDQRGAKGRRRGSRGLKKLFCQGGGQQSLIDDDCPLCNRSHWQIYNLPWRGLHCTN